ncbi:MAG: hypothetical protein IT445_04040 [Phycisphaeraceae bacterium]|nr:hypothetical protein [Phycisphaeraceae bacterium]
MLTDQLKLVPGNVRDYLALAEHHYRSARPATMARVLALRRVAPTVVGRYLKQPQRTQTVAVLVESLPALMCRMRNLALDDRYGTWLLPGERARLLNAELRCISRVVVHPQWRGLGLAVKLVRHALDSATTIYTEALAAMGKVNPFFERAGMTAYHRPRHAFDDRLHAALSQVNLSCHDLTDLDAAWRHIEQLPAAQQTWLLSELQRWYRQLAGRSSCASADPRDHLRYARDHLLLEPVYYLRDNREQP